MTDAPLIFKRDVNTGLIEGVEYPRFPNGKIDWKALINPVHIAFKTANNSAPTPEQIKIAAQIEKAYGAPASQLVYADVVKKQAVDDRHIVIILAGFMEVAELRGYSSSIPTHLAIDQGIVAVAHSITWLPNEEEPYAKTSSGTADATMDNTGGFGYLTAMAGNRAFVRAVKNGLGIRVLGFDEIARKDDATPESGGSQMSSVVSQPGQPVATLTRTCKEHNFSFAVLKKNAITKYESETKELEKNPEYKRMIESDPSTWEGFDSVPPRDCATLISRIKANAAATAAAAKK